MVVKLQWRCYYVDLIIYRTHNSPGNDLSVFQLTLIRKYDEVSFTQLFTQLKYIFISITKIVNCETPMFFYYLKYLYADVFSLIMGFTDYLLIYILN